MQRQSSGTLLQVCGVWCAHACSFIRRGPHITGMSSAMRESAPAACGHVCAGHSLMCVRTCVRRVSAHVCTHVEISLLVLLAQPSPHITLHMHSLSARCLPHSHSCTSSHTARAVVHSQCPCTHTARALTRCPLHTPNVYAGRKRDTLSTGPLAPAPGGLPAPWSSRVTVVQVGGLRHCFW